MLSWKRFIIAGKRPIGQAWQVVVIIARAKHENKPAVRSVLGFSRQPHEVPVLVIRHANCLSIRSPPVNIDKEKNAIRIRVGKH